MIRQRPISRGTYRYKRKAKLPSVLHYELILDGAVRVYPDHREVCQENPKGRAEYRRRIELMLVRQNGMCSLQISSFCPKRLSFYTATFEHTKSRKMQAAFRDDRIVDAGGKPMNSAACWSCNGQKGSKRI